MIIQPNILEMILSVEHLTTQRTTYTCAILLATYILCQNVNIQLNIVTPVDTHAYTVFSVLVRVHNEYACMYDQECINSLLMFPHSFGGKWHESDNNIINEYMLH